MRATIILAVRAIGESMIGMGGDREERLSMLMKRERRETDGSSTELLLEELQEFLIKLGFDETSSALASEARRKGYHLRSREIDGEGGSAKENRNIIHMRKDRRSNGGDLSSKKSHPRKAETREAVQHELVERAQELRMKAHRATSGCQRKSTVMTLMRKQEEGNLSSRKTMLEAAVSMKYDSCGVVACLRGHRSALLHLDIVPKSLCFSSASCSELVFTASLDNTMRLWSVRAGEGECVAITKAEGMELADARMMEFDHALACSDGGDVGLFDLLNAKCVSKYKFPSQADVDLAEDEEEAKLGCSYSNSERCCAASTLFAVGSRENFIPIWDHRQEAACMALKRSSTIKGSIKSLQFNPNGRELFVLGSQSSVIWDLRQQQVISTLRVHDGLRGGRRCPDKAIYNFNNSTIIAEFGSSYVGRHRPSPRISHHIFSAASDLSPTSSPSLSPPGAAGSLVSSFDLPFSSPSLHEELIDANFALDSSSSFTMHPLQGGRVAVCRAQDGRMLSEKSVERGQVEFNLVACNKSTMQTSKSLEFAASDLDGNVWVWGSDEELMGDFAKKESQLAQSRQRMREALL